jgi:hypothetical protein
MSTPSSPITRRALIIEYFCHRCRGWWRPKGAPKRCGNCKTKYWRTPSKEDQR